VSETWRRQNMLYLKEHWCVTQEAMITRSLWSRETSVSKTPCIDCRYIFYNWTRPSWNQLNTKYFVTEWTLIYNAVYHTVNYIHWNVRPYRVSRFGRENVSSDVLKTLHTPGHSKRNTHLTNTQNITFHLKVMQICPQENFRKFCLMPQNKFVQRLCLL